MNHYGPLGFACSFLGGWRDLFGSVHKFNSLGEAGKEKRKMKKERVIGFFLFFIYFFYLYPYLCPPVYDPRRKKSDEMKA